MKKLLFLAALAVSGVCFGIEEPQKSHYVSVGIQPLYIFNNEFSYCTRTIEGKNGVEMEFGIRTDFNYNNSLRAKIGYVRYLNDNFYVSVGISPWLQVNRAEYIKAEHDLVPIRTKSSEVTLGVYVPVSFGYEFNLMGHKHYVQITPECTKLDVEGQDKYRFTPSIKFGFEI